MKFFTGEVVKSIRVEEPVGLYFHAETQTVYAGTVVPLMLYIPVLFYTSRVFLCTLYYAVQLM